MKIKLNNFQILEGENTFEFNSGINVVVGPNASGKSSMFYAIENCLTNPNGVDDCINYNHKQTDVTIENNGNSVTWTRTQGSCTYTDNVINQVYSKASKLDSRDIADLGFYFDNKNRVVNIHSEWDVLFPFGESDSDMFRLFEDIFNISCSFQIIDEMKKDESTIKSSITSSQSEKASLQAKLTSLNQIKDKVKSEDIQNHIDAITVCSQNASDIRDDYNKFSKCMLLNNLNLPELFDVSTLYEKLHEWETIQTDYDYYQKNKNKADIQIPAINLNLDDICMPTEITQDYDSYITNTNNVIQYEEQLQVLQIKQQELEEQIKKINVCPTCGHILEN